MGWADRAIEELREGRQAVIRPHGGSMRPLVESGATVTLAPVDVQGLEVGDVVLCRVAGNVYLHLVKAIQGAGADRRVQIGNNRAVYGRAIRIENP